MRAFPLLAGILLSGSSLFGQAASSPDSDLPLFDLPEVEVIHSETEFAPIFSGDMPTFSHYEAPQLPRGELILALEFMDQYRDNPVPGQYKWAGLLHFPIIDGHDRAHIKYICLYLYDSRMFAYDPTAMREYERRFAVPIQYGDRMNRDVLFRFAQSYVQSIFPGGEEMYYFEEAVDPEDPGAGFEETIEYIDVPPGRIAPIFSSQRGKKPEELVRLIYRYSEEPNPQPDTEVRMGRLDKDDKDEPFSWAAFWEELTAVPDPIEVARQLVAPRWARKAVFHYPQDILFLWKIQARQTVLLFNIGMRIYAYDPDFGVWRTDATISDLNGDEPPPVGKLKYPGVDQLDRVEFMPVGDGSE
jgi:hypothetical protein